MFGNTTYPMNEATTVNPSEILYTDVEDTSTLPKNHHESSHNNDALPQASDPLNDATAANHTGSICTDTLGNTAYRMRDATTANHVLYCDLEFTTVHGETVESAIQTGVRRKREDPAPSTRSTRRASVALSNQSSVLSRSIRVKDPVPVIAPSTQTTSVPSCSTGVKENDKELAASAKGAWEYAPIQNVWSANGFDDGNKNLALGQNASQRSLPADGDNITIRADVDKKAVGRDLKKEWYDAGDVLASNIIATSMESAAATRSSTRIRKVTTEPRISVARVVATARRSTGVPARRGADKKLESTQNHGPEAITATPQMQIKVAHGEHRQNGPAVDLEPYISPLTAICIPESLRERWTFDPKTRVLKGDFRHVVQVHDDDRTFLLSMMEKDDISVVSEGLLDAYPSGIDMAELATTFGMKPHHKFRRFDRITDENGKKVFKEGGTISMKMSDFVAYMNLRLRMDSKCKPFSFEDGKHRTHSFANAEDVALYFIDCDMPKYLPSLNKEYKHRFKVKEILPGGTFCMMTYVSCALLSREFSYAALDVLTAFDIFPWSQLPESGALPLVSFYVQTVGCAHTWSMILMISSETVYGTELVHYSGRIYFLSSGWSWYSRFRTHMPVRLQ
jgi:hypothetical protein